MKARLPALSSNQRAKAIAEVEKMVKEEMTKQSEQIVRRNMKLMCHALNEFFGFGKHRLSKLISEIGKLSAEADNDEFFGNTLTGLILIILDYRLRENRRADNGK